MVGDRDLLTGGYVFNFRMVEALRDAGHRVDVLHYRTLPADVRGRILPRAGYVAGELRRTAPDLLIVSKSYKVMLPLVLSRRLPSAPVLYLVHHLEWRNRGLSRGPLPRRLAVRRLLRRADAVWANSLSTAGDLEELGIRPSDVTVIPPGFERPRKPLPDRSRRSGPTRILTVGALCPRKGQIELVRACAALGDRDFRLAIVGDRSDPGYADELDREIGRLGLGERVRLTGQLEREELYGEYARADVLAQASSWEGYGIAVAEAMWMGLPVVATTGGATPEVMGESQPGILVEPGDVEGMASALRRLLDDRKERLAMGARARARAESLPDWDEAGRRFVELAESTAEGGG
jgi:glycosyltransferase involved in cell wall biosynthesis